MNGIDAVIFEFFVEERRSGRSGRGGPDVGHLHSACDAIHRAKVDEDLLETSVR